MPWLVIGALWGSWSCSWRAVPPASQVRLPPRIAESSGLVASPSRPGVLWTHNDSGGRAELFAVDGQGRLLQRVSVTGAAAVDWEELALGPDGSIWVADTGNNGIRAYARRDLTVYRVDEPTPGVEEVPVTTAVRFAYPDQDVFPDPEQRFDAEALFFDGPTLYLITKRHKDLLATLYRFPALEGEVVLERLGDVDVGGDPRHYGGMVTAADLSPDGAWLAVLTYHAILLFPRPGEGQTWVSTEPRRIAIDQQVADQCEAIAWMGSDLVFTNEDGWVFRVTDPIGSAVTSWP